MRARYKNLSIETIFDVVPATEKQLRRIGCENVSRYKWMTSDGKMPFTEDEIEILEEDENRSIAMQSILLPTTTTLTFRLVMVGLEHMEKVVLLKIFSIARSVEINLSNY